jgi:hypothetical protein
MYIRMYMYIHAYILYTCNKLKEYYVENVKFT